MKAETLNKKARKLALSRGHDLGRFVVSRSNHDREESNSVISVTQCKKCKRLVTTTTKPWPNEIDIGGEAIAVYCRLLPSRIEALSPRIRTKGVTHA